MANLKRIYGWGEESRSIEVRWDSGRLDLTEGTESHSFDVSLGPDGAYRLETPEATLKGYAVRDGDSVWVFARGHYWKLSIEKPGARSGSAGGTAVKDEIHAPMTGTVRQVNIEVGEMVEKGQAVIVLEAMKMEHVLKAPRDGRVAELNCHEGDQADSDQLLLRLEPEKPSEDEPGRGVESATTGTS